MQRLASLMFVLALGCGDGSNQSAHDGADSSVPPTKPPVTSGTGGSGGGGAGSAGSSAAGAGATGGVDGGAAGGVAGMAGGGSADAGSAADASEPPPVDTAAAAQALAEISQGLTAPTVDCRDSTGFSIGCVSVSGTYGDKAVDLSCVDAPGLVYVSGEGGGVQCEGDVSGHPLNINLHLGPIQPRSPGEFATTSTTKDTYLSYDDFDNEVRSHRNGVYQLEGSYDRRLAVVGTAEVAAGSGKLRMDGEFAASYTPNGSCMPNADGLGCETVLVRGTFAAFPIVR